MRIKRITSLFLFAITICALTIIFSVILSPPKAIKPPNPPQNEAPIVTDIPPRILEGAEDEIASVINLHRKENDLYSFEIDSELTKAAEIRSKELFENDYFEHQRPDGEFWSSVLSDDLGVSFKGAGENIAVMYTDMKDYKTPFSPGKWYTLWENSPTHFENMMSNDFKYMGCAVYEGTKDGEYYAYATTIFCSY